MPLRSDSVVEPLAVDHSEALGAEVVDQILLIPTCEIEAGERLRAIDPVWAAALGQMMTRDGQQTPIEVCRLPGRRQWTLVAGGHRHAGAISSDIPHLRAIVVSAGRDDRRLREVNENLARKDLDPIDRAAFLAELVGIHKRRAGIADAHRVASVPTSHTKAINAEADDTLDTMSNVYGWSEEIGEQIGFSGRTIRRDLFLFRRLAPSQVTRLRAARHPAATHAGQLRALAKYDEAQQRAIVDLLVIPGASLNYAQPRTVAEAIVHPLGLKPAAAVDAGSKRLSAFIGAFSRMSMAEKRGALAHLADLLPPGLSIEGLGA